MNFASLDTWITLWLVASTAYAIRGLFVLATDEKRRHELFDMELPFPLPRAMWCALLVTALVLASLWWPRGVWRSFRRDRTS